MKSIYKNILINLASSALVLALSAVALYFLFKDDINHIKDFSLGVGKTSFEGNFGNRYNNLMDKALLEKRLILEQQNRNINLEILYSVLKDTSVIRFYTYAIEKDFQICEALKETEKRVPMCQHIMDQKIKNRYKAFRKELVAYALIFQKEKPNNIEEIKETCLFKEYEKNHRNHLENSKGPVKPSNSDFTDQLFALLNKCLNKKNYQEVSYYYLIQAINEIHNKADIEPGLQYLFQGLAVTPWDTNLNLRVGYILAVRGTYGLQPILYWQRALNSIKSTQNALIQGDWNIFRRFRLIQGWIKQWTHLDAIIRLKYAEAKFRNIIAYYIADKKLKSWRKTGFANAQKSVEIIEELNFDCRSLWRQFVHSSKFCDQKGSHLDNYIVELYDTRAFLKLQFAQSYSEVQYYKEKLRNALDRAWENSDDELGKLVLNHLNRADVLLAQMEDYLEIRRVEKFKGNQETKN